MHYDVFATDKDKREATTHLPQLIESSGWQLLLKALDANMRSPQETDNIAR